MRMIVTLIVISLLLLTAGIVCVYAMHQGLDALMLEADAAAQALPGETGTAAEALARFDARWAHLEELWQLFAIHEDLDAISEALLEAQDGLRAGDADAAKVACDRLLLCLRTLHRKEIPSLGNIF